MPGYHPKDGRQGRRSAGIKDKGTKKFQTHNKGELKSYYRPHYGKKWDDSLYVKIYLLAKDGLTDTQISQALQVDRTVFYKWRDSNTTLQESLAQARTEEAGGGNLYEFVHGRLPERLIPVWDDIMKVDELEADYENAKNRKAASYKLCKKKRRRLKRMLENCGRRMKQQLWVHALVNSNFNKSEACRKVGFSKGLVDQWVKNDPYFLELIDSILEMKKDFVEGCMFGLIKAGDVPTTLFVARTLLRDRGYDPKLTIVHEKKVTTVDVNKLFDQMSLPAKQEFLKAMQSVKQLPTPKALPPKKSKAIPVDAEVVDD